MEVQEKIIIKRRRSHDHDTSHGGVWKVAFADFMTAMMAFFLVLWIVNSTSKETRSSVARYFNPIRLSDTTPARKGLQDPKETDFDASSSTNPSSTKPKEPPSTGSGGGVSEKDRLGDSSKIAPPLVANSPILPVGQSRIPKDKLSTPDRFREYPVPSDQLNNISSVKIQIPGRKKEDVTITPHSPVSLQQASRVQVELERQNTQEDNSIQTLDPPENPMTNKPKSSLNAAENPTHNSVSKVSGSPTELSFILSKISSDIDSLSKDTNLGVSIQVKPISEGVLLSILDSSNMPMFRSGSAKMTIKSRRILEQLGKVISRIENPIVIAGYTDASPYQRNGSNWRLSALRAEEAMDILIRSGIAMKRVEKLEAYADRRPKEQVAIIGDNARRIDILLRY